MPMLTINVIDCNRKDCTEAFTYAPFNLNKSSTARKISVFEDLNVIQIEIKKDDPRWVDWLTIW